MTDDGCGNQYLIPEANWPKFKKTIEALSKKSMKLGHGEIIPMVFGSEHVTLGLGKVITAYNVVLSVPDISIKGWTFQGVVHFQKGQAPVVRTNDDSGSIPLRFTETTCWCDHCSSNRKRNRSYILKNDETGEYKQVGSTCLKDFVKTDTIDHAAKLAELFFDMRRMAQSYTNMEGIPGEQLRFHTEIFLQSVAAVVHREGRFVTASEARNTNGSSTAAQALLVENITRQDMQLATASLRHVQTLTPHEITNDYLWNLHSAAKQEMFPSTQVNFIAGIVNAYLKHLETPAPTEPASQFIGSPGKALNINVKLNYVADTQKDFPSFLHRGVTELGDVVTFFNKTKMGEVGDTIFMRGTVKEHQLFRGVRSTRFSYCKLL